jgi:hypothetical protein
VAPRYHAGSRDHLEPVDVDAWLTDSWRPSRPLAQHRIRPPRGAHLADGAVRKLTDHVEATDVAACPCSTWNRTSRTDLTEFY